MEKFIADYPALAVTIAGVVFAFLWALVKLAAGSYNRRIEERFAAVDVRNASQDRRIGSLAGDVRKIDSMHAAVSRLEGHTEKLVETVTGVRVEQAELCARVSAVEAKLPNGELRELAEAFTMLAKHSEKPKERKRPGARMSI